MSFCFGYRTLKKYGFVGLRRAGFGGGTCAGFVILRGLDLALTFFFVSDLTVLAGFPLTGLFVVDFESDFARFPIQSPLTFP